MLKITIAEENQKARTIRVPYPLISAVGRIATTKFFQKWLEARIRKLENRKHWQLGEIHINDLLPLVKEMKKYKGLMIVDIQGDNGQVVKIEL